jgi:HK97 gp10 family phage protein
MVTRLQISGLEQLRANLSLLSRRKEAKVLRAALRVGAAPMRQRASGLAPREEGAPDYADHIIIADGRGASVRVGPSTDPRTDEPQTTYAEQGLFLEFGTDDTRPQPSLGPAFDQTAPQAIGPIGAAIWRSLVADGFSTRGTSGSGGLL